MRRSRKPWEYGRFVSEVTLSFAPEFAGGGLDSVIGTGVSLLERGEREAQWMLGAGIEPAWDLIPRDFKSLASTGFATRAENDEPEKK
jgi:hypothetical protein